MERVWEKVIGAARIDEEAMSPERKAFFKSMLKSSDLKVEDGFVYIAHWEA